MIYGLYLSASGIISSSHKQDVISNNLANSETVGFKRDLPIFQQRLTELEERRRVGNAQGWSDSVEEGQGGGLFVSPSQADMQQGDLEHTGAPLDTAIEGKGFFAVRDSVDAGPGAAAQSSPISLTRNGQFMVDRKGYLVLGSQAGQKVLDVNKQPIKLDPTASGTLSVSRDGTVAQGRKAVGQIGVFNVADTSKLTKQGGTLLGYGDAGNLQRVESPLRGEFLERSNVDPTNELSELMKAQRLLEANANMIRYQDQMLAKLVNEVGKIS